MTNPKVERPTVIKAYEVTGRFEGKGYSALSGNFDGAGISWGFIQWNLGSGTLQPLLLAMQKEGPATFKKCLTQLVAGETKPRDLSGDLLAVCALPKDQAVAWAAQRQDGGHRLLPHWTRAFNALAAEAGFQAIQRRFAKRYMDVAQSYVRAYGFKTERALCLMFDIAVQCGSITKGSRGRIATATGGKVLPELPMLDVIAKAVSLQDSRGWVQRDILSRKRAIALGSGVVHGSPVQLERDHGVTTGPIRP